MKAILKVIFFAFFCFGMIIGCNGYCLTVDGTYKEISGGITYCVDQQKTAAVSRLILTNEKNDSAILVTDKEVQILNEELAAQLPEASNVNLSQKGMTKSQTAYDTGNFANFVLMLNSLKDKKAAAQNKK